MALNHIKDFLSSYTWDLAIGYYDEELLKTGINWSKLTIVRNPYKKKWFADPFILSEDNNSLQLFVEEYDCDVRKGRIARIVVSKMDYTIVDCNIVLELDTHLSFPAIYRQGDIIYVHPENSKSGKSTIYRYDSSYDKLVDPVVLVEEPLTDAVIMNNNDSYYLYSTHLKNNSGPFLYIYKSSLLTTPFDKVDVIDFEQGRARNAGAFLHTKYGMIRPTQDCSHDYGEAVLFYKGKDLIGEIRPNKKSRYAGVHTFNTLENTFVIDLKKYTYYRLREMAKHLVGKK